MACEPRRMQVEVAGGSLFVEVSGRGPALLMIHGWPLDHRLFVRQVGPLSESLRVITFDRRGFGQSTAPPGMDAELSDIDALLDALRLDSAHILGMSQGGRLALRYAATRPARVRSLILQGAAVDGVDVEERAEERVPVSEFAALAKAGRLESVIKQWLAHPMMNRPPLDAETTQIVEEILHGYTGRDLVDFGAGTYAFAVDVLKRLSNFDPPVLVLTGAKETAARHAHAAELLRHVPDGREIVLQESGHLANLTQPDVYNRSVIDFVWSAERHARPDSPHDKQHPAA